jgi:hypothetical protein
MHFFARCIYSVVPSHWCNFSKEHLFIGSGLTREKSSFSSYFFGRSSGGLFLNFHPIQTSDRFSEHMGWFKMGQNPWGKVLIQSHGGQFSNSEYPENLIGFRPIVLPKKGVCLLPNYLTPFSLSKDGIRVLSVPYVRPFDDNAIQYISSGR